MVQRDSVVFCSLFEKTARYHHMTGQTDFLLETEEPGYCHKNSERGYTSNLESSKSILAKHQLNINVNSCILCDSVTTGLGNLTI